MQYRFRGLRFFEHTDNLGDKKDPEASVRISLIPERSYLQVTGS